MLCYHSHLFYESDPDNNQSGIIQSLSVYFVFTSYFGQIVTRIKDFTLIVLLSVIIVNGCPSSTLTTFNMVLPSLKDPKLLGLAEVANIRLFPSLFLNAAFKMTVNSQWAPLSSRRQDFA